MKTFWRLLQYLREYKIRLLIALVCSGAVAGLTPIYPYSVKVVLDDVLINKNQELLGLFPLALIALVCIKGLFSYGQSYLMNYVGHWLVSDVRQQLFVQIVRLPIRFHDANTSGRLVASV